MENVPPFPTTWEELVALRSYIDRCPGTYLRHPEDQQFYDLYRNLTPKDIFLEVIIKQIEPQETKLIKNRFPYTRILQFLPDVAQYTLWNLRGPMSEREIEQGVKNVFPDKVWMAVESSPERKSVPEIWHTHVFVKDIPQYSL